MKLRTIVWMLALMPGLASTARAADVYQLDAVHSSVVFRVKHMGVGYSVGRFNDISGTVTIDEQNMAATTMNIQIKVDSIDTNNAMRDKHLKNADFFDVEKFPMASFVSKSMKLVKDQTYEVSGDLTIHGVTRPVTLNMDRVGAGKDPKGVLRTGFEGSITIKRSDFGMNFMLGGISDDVWLLICFEAAKQ
jgi:polyisoprenoid-binding protein YceI